MQLSEAIKPLLDVSSSRKFESSHVQLLDDDQGSDCQGFNIDLATAQRDFTALQYALFIAVFVQVFNQKLTSYATYKHTLITICN